MSLFASSVALAVGLFAPACAMKQKAAEPASPHPGVHSSDLPMGNVQEAQVAFDDAESNLKGMLGEQVTSGVEPAPPPVSPGPQPTAEPGTTPLYAGEEDRCAVACRAFGSMQRSAERLCELTGDDDDRCGDVRRRVDFARNLVHSVCPACAEAD